MNDCQLIDLEIVFFLIFNLILSNGKQEMFDFNRNLKMFSKFSMRFEWSIIEVN